MTNAIVNSRTPDSKGCLGLTTELIEFKDHHVKDTFFATLFPSIISNFLFNLIAIMAV